MLRLNLLFPKLQPAPRPGAVCVHRATGVKAAMIQRDGSCRAYYWLSRGEGKGLHWRGLEFVPENPTPTPREELYTFALDAPADLYERLRWGVYGYFEYDENGKATFVREPRRFGKDAP